MEKILDAIGEAIGADAIFTEVNDRERHATDASGEPPVLAKAVIRPSTTEQVSAILSLCTESGQAVTVQGGRTGLTGGAIPGADELVLSMERLVGIEEIDVESMTLTALAGTPLETIQRAAAEAGLLFPLDLGARGSCNIGGNIATNAGGNGVIKYGMARALVLGLEAVLANGTIISSMNKMLKNNSGYDLKQLFIGTEGTLGVVTRVVLRLFPARAGKHTALCALDSFDKAVSFLHHVQAETGGVSAFELMWASYFQYSVKEVETLRDPFVQEYPFYVLLELESSGSQGDEDQFEQLLFGQLDGHVLADAVIAQTLGDAAMFWQIRDAVGDFMPRLPPFANFDVSVPISQAQSFMQRVEREFADHFPGALMLFFGHLGDSNLHIIASTGDEAGKKKIYDHVYRIIGEFEGSVSAEHGIGRQKRKYLGMSRGENEIALMRSLKAALDPQGTLNPGRVL